METKTSTMVSPIPTPCQDWNKDMKKIEEQKKYQVQDNIKKETKTNWLKIIINNQDISLKWQDDVDNFQLARLY